MRLEPAPLAIFQEKTSPDSTKLAGWTALVTATRKSLQAPVGRRKQAASGWNLTLGTLFQALSGEDSEVSNALNQKKRWGNLVNHTSIQSLSVKGRAVALIALCEVLALSLWFPATAVLPALKLEANLDAFRSSLFTSLVAVGFVFGTLASALLGLADRLEPRHFFRASAWAGASPVYANVVTFTVIGVGGGVGCLIGGLCADRFGRTVVTIVAMATSGSCALAAGLLYGADWRLTAGLCLVWGVAGVADSAQFSSSVIELSDPAHVGTMLTTQTCAGFLLTLVTIHLVPLLVDVVGWPWAFAALAPGPFLGVVAMAMLRRRPEAARLAGGRG